MDLKEYIKRLGLPGVISLLSLLAAWLAITLLLNGQLKYSVIMAALAFVLDTLDGYAARRLNKVSELGRQLDSMVDLVGYSVYSALLTSQVILPGWLGIAAGFAILMFGLLRLIRFNTEGYVQAGSTNYYRGLVVCHMSLATIGLLLVSTQLTIPPIFLAIVLTGLAILQLSDIKTRKTSMLPVWYALAAALVFGAVVWLQ